MKAGPKQKMSCMGYDLPSKVVTPCLQSAPASRPLSRFAEKYPVHPTCRDPDGGLGARRRERRTARPSCGPRHVGSSGCCSASSSSRRSATSASTGSPMRTSTPDTTTWRPVGRRSRRSPTACCAPSSRARPRSGRPVHAVHPAHIRGAGSTKRAHQVQPATLAELERLVAELPGIDLKLTYGSLRVGDPGSLVSRRRRELVEDRDRTLAWD